MKRLSLLEKEDRPSRDLVHEGEELIYHVCQRISFSFTRNFQESFHPSLLREDAGNLKAIFAACGAEMMRTTQRELEQELWATTLRLESTGRRLVHEAAEAASAELLFSPEEFHLMENEEASWPSPSELECQLQVVEWSTLWGHFKSPRYFFEGAGREQVKGAAEPLVKEAVNVAAAEQKKKLLAHYVECITSELKVAADRLQEGLAEQEKAMLDLLKGGESADHWGQLGHQLSLLEHSFVDRIDKNL
jgi:hypothetical protein